MRSNLSSHFSFIIVLISSIFLFTSLALATDILTIKFFKKTPESGLLFDTNDYIVTIDYAQETTSSELYDIEHYIDGQHIKTFEDQSLPVELNLACNGLTTGLHDLLIKVKDQNNTLIQEETFKAMVAGAL